jgi:site-specific DNA-cytosine methylase
MNPVLLSLFPGVDLWGHAFELEWPEACIVRGPDPIFGSLSDIRKFHPPPGVFHGIFGGPPCQSFSSLVHLVRANGHEPRFGNLIPEFERCVHEGQPDWFCMENVPAAPKPSIEGYGVHSFLLNNAWLLAADGFGQEQERKRMFTFGVKGREAPNLMRWIDVAALMLTRAGTVTQWTPNNEPLRKKGENTVVGTDGTTPAEYRRRLKSAVTGTLDETPVKIGGSGKLKRRHEAIHAGHDRTPSRRDAVTSNVGGKTGSQARRYKLPDACRLQGLPETFLDDAPFTADGKLKAIANGVCMFTGRAIARAIREATP